MEFQESSQTVHVHQSAARDYDRHPRGLAVSPLKAEGQGRDAVRMRTLDRGLLLACQKVTVGRVEVLKDKGTVNCDWQWELAGYRNHRGEFIPIKKPAKEGRDAATKE